MEMIFRDLTLWAAIFSLAILIGGTVFHIMVIVPVWLQNLPDSIAAFGKSDVKPALFWTSRFLRAIAGVTMLAAVLANWNTPRQYWVLASCLFFATAVAITVGYFIPELKKMGLLGGRPSIDDPAALTRALHNWLFADKFRFYLLVLPAFFLLLEALSVAL